MWPKRKGISFDLCGGLERERERERKEARLSSKSFDRSFALKTLSYAERTLTDKIAMGDDDSARLSVHKSLGGASGKISFLFRVIITKTLIFLFFYILSRLLGFCAFGGSLVMNWFKQFDEFRGNS